MIISFIRSRADNPWFFLVTVQKLRIYHQEVTQGGFQNGTKCCKLNWLGTKMSETFLGIKRQADVDDIAVRNRPKFFGNIFEFSPLQLWYFSFLRVDSYQNFQIMRTKTCFLGSTKYFSSAKCIFDHEKDQNRYFCQAKMKVYDLGYLLWGRISSSECASREKYEKTSKIQESFKFIWIKLYIFIGFSFYSSIFCCSKLSDNIHLLWKH